MLQVAVQCCDLPFTNLIHSGNNRAKLRHLLNDTHAQEHMGHSHIYTLVFTHQMTAPAVCRVITRSHHGVRVRLHA